LGGRGGNQRGCGEHLRELGQEARNSGG
jgi:hypothetical protein